MAERLKRSIRTLGRWLTGATVPGPEDRAAILAARAELAAKDAACVGELMGPAAGEWAWLAGLRKRRAALEASLARGFQAARRRLELSEGVRDPRPGEPPTLTLEQVERAKRFFGSALVIEAPP